MLSQLGLDFSSDSDVEGEQPKATEGRSQAPDGAPQLQEQAEESHLVDQPEDPVRQSALQHAHVFWFMQRPAKSASGQDTFESSLRQIASFQTAEHFWRIYDHLARAPQLSQSTDVHLFREGIKPTWEDPSNKLGGKFVVRLSKGLAARFWEELLLGIIGEQFGVGNEICGAVLSIRYSEDIISLWNKTANNSETTAKIRDALRRILRLPGFIQTEYKPHAQSISDKSSFRNTSAWRAGGGGGPRASGPPTGRGAGGLGSLASDQGGDARGAGSVPHPDSSGAWSRNRHHQGGHFRGTGGDGAGRQGGAPTRDINARWR